MAESKRTFTGEQIMKMTTALRAAAELPPQRFTVEDAVGMISDEIEILRDQGKDDASIVAVLSDVGVTITEEELRAHYASPDLRIYHG